MKLTGWEIPGWEGPDGVSRKVHSAATTLQKELRAELAKIDGDVRIRKDAVPALRKEAATKIRRSLRRLGTELQLQRSRHDVAIEQHQRTEKDGPRAAELRNLLRSMDANARQAFYARAIADDDREVLEAVRSAPKAVQATLATQEYIGRIADHLDPQTAERIEQQADAIGLADVAVRVVSGEIESTTQSRAGEFNAVEQREQLLDADGWTARESSEGRADRKRFGLTGNEATTGRDVGGEDAANQARVRAEDAHLALMLAQLKAAEDGRARAQQALSDLDELAGETTSTETN